MVPSEDGLTEFTPAPAPLFHPASTVTCETLLRIVSLLCSKLLQQLLPSLITEFTILTGKQKPP